MYVCNICFKLDLKGHCLYIVYIFCLFSSKNKYFSLLVEFCSFQKASHNFKCFKNKEFVFFDPSQKPIPSLQLSKVLFSSGKRIVLLKVFFSNFLTPRFYEKRSVE